MESGIIVVVVLMGVAALVMGILHIRAGIPTKSQLENAEYSIALKRGHKKRRGQLQRLSATFLAAFALLTFVSALWTVPALVREMRDAQYDFSTGTTPISGVLIAEAALTVVGAIVTFVLWVRAYRRLQVVKAMPDLDK